ncbi:DEAD/DEAH box helicase [Streptomyces aureus]|uniref:DEAD/DEAH box helicase n=1 Tax=Streptomyces aureus TaxID=193461 RepID=UPI001FD78C31|nr:DEAD/DEAH box helicase family protein [Streptomyces aureus]
MSTQPVWAEERFGRNRVRQLLVPGGSLQVTDEAGALSVSNVYGRWPAVRTASAAADELTAVLADGPGRSVDWQGSHAHTPQTVVESFRNAIAFRPHDEPHSLRRPQVGALHAVMGYWNSGLGDPGIVVMPTGTGKTETMMALLVAARMERLLVLVPSAALRDQIAGKFETLGILQEQQIVTLAALRPRVGRLDHGFKDAEEAVRFVEACNVVVATPQILNRSVGNVRAALLSSFSHLIVDEAHHAAARTWASVINDFAGRPVLLFTATPFREDRRSLPGRTIFRFPLREAQRDGYFRHINYRAVIGLHSPDEELAQLAVDQLRLDRTEGHDHVLMARAGSIAQAEQITAIYRRLAPEFDPTVVHQDIGVKRRQAAVSALRQRTCRIIVCVDMLGEGFDEPALKIAAMHEPRKSLSPMIQFIGRFTRTASGLGEATVLVLHEASASSSPLRHLLREDADWNVLLRDITDRVTSEAEATSEFDSSFQGAPAEVAVTVLEPKMSAVAYMAPSEEWRPEEALTLFRGNSEVLGDAVSLGDDQRVAWFVVERRDKVRWGAPQALEQVVYELFILYFDKERRLLYLHGSEKSGNYKELAEAVLGDDCELINGPRPYRVLAQVDRLIPTNVGLKDSHNHFTRFSLHVGSDVSQGFDSTQEHKTKTHVAASGFDNGESISINAASSGRFWSTSTASSLKAWIDWCDKQGTKLLDTSINLRQVFEGFIIPEDLTKRPELTLLAVQWPWSVYTGSRDRLTVTYGGHAVALTDVGFRVDDYSPTGPFLFSLVSENWEVPYQATVDAKGLTYRPRGQDADVTVGGGRNARSRPLVQWLNANKPDLFLEGDRLIDGDGKLINPRYERRPFDTALLTPLDWRGVDFTKESQKPQRRTDSIQYYMSAHLRANGTFDVLIDDDRSGEAADLVGLQVNGEYLDVTLVHCKYSKKKAGTRVADLYEVCGQAVGSAKWRRSVESLLEHLRGRAVQYTRRNPGISPYEVGEHKDLIAIMDRARLLLPRFHTVIAQPGLRAGTVTDRQLYILAGAETYARQVTAGDFTVYCSQ